MEMLNHVAGKDDLENMKVSMMREVDTNTKVSIAEAVGPLKLELHDLKGRVAVMEASGCAGVGDGGEGQKSIEESVAQLRKKVEKATPDSSQGTTRWLPDENARTLVMGGIDDASFQAAVK